MVKIVYDFEANDYHMKNHLEQEGDHVKRIIKNIAHLKSPTIMDIGGNIGIHCVNYAINIPEAKIYSFEPSKHNFALLEKHIKKYNLEKNIAAYNQCISKKKGVETVYYNEKNCGDTRMNNKGYSSDKDASHRHEIDCTTIDAFVEENDINLDFIKIDTQGHEFFILEGAQKTIRDHKPVIFMEFWPHGLVLNGCELTDEILDVFSSYKYIYAVDSEKQVETDIGYLKDFFESRRNRNYHIDILLTGEPMQ